MVILRERVTPNRAVSTALAMAGAAALALAR
jgi:hypothetical protein